MLVSPLIFITSHLGILYEFDYYPTHNFNYKHLFWVDRQGGTWFSFILRV